MDRIVAQSVTIKDVDGSGQSLDLSLGNGIAPVAEHLGLTTSN